MPKQKTIVHPIGLAELLPKGQPLHQTIAAVAQRALFTYGETEQQQDSIEVRPHGAGFAISADIPGNWETFNFRIREAFNLFGYHLAPQAPLPIVTA